jgi:glycosyltransferase involved in cell wall biosynthesis
VACARQAGLEAAQGTFVVQADADTEYARDWLSRILQAFKLNPDAVAVAGGFRYREPKTFESAEWIMRNLANMGSQAFTGRLLMVSGANFGFYRKALLACGGYRQHAFSADQYDVAARLSRLGRIIYDPHLNAITSARRVQRPALEIAVLFMRFVMGLHLNIFRFFFIDQFREWMPSGNSKVRIMKYIHTSASMLFTFAFTLLAIWGYFVVFKLPLPFNTP